MFAVKEWSTIDKASWGKGAWQQEPDKIQWVDEATGLDCLMHRGPHGGWCGYVGVAEGHPAFAKEYEHVDADVHGGLTYSDFCQKHPSGTEHPEVGICHVPYEGRPHRVWWLGFDCAHFGDLSPAHRNEFRSRYPRSYESYRDRAYVEDQCRQLARQLHTMTAAEVPHG